MGPTMGAIRVVAPKSFSHRIHEFKHEKIAISRTNGDFLRARQGKVLGAVIVGAPPLTK